MHGTSCNEINNILIQWRLVHTVSFFVCDCDLFTCNFMKNLFTRCDGCGCDLLCIHIGIEHRNHTEWVWNPFMCDIEHRNASHAEQIAPCEHFHKPTYNPFYFIKLHVNKSQSQTKEKRTVWTSLQFNWNGATGTVLKIWK